MMEDQGTFNNKGFYSIFRLLLSDSQGNANTLSSLIQLPEMKEPDSYDWQDENGVEVYLDKRYVKPRTITLEFLMMADSEAEFWTCYQLLLSEMIAPGTIRLYIEELKRSFFVYYTRQSNTKALTLFSQGGKVCANFMLEFIEPQPSLFRLYTYLTDGNGNYILTPNGQKILVA